MMLKINIITLFPELIQPHFNYKPFKKAQDLELISLNIVNLRNFALDKYGSVDDKPYGGGAGMLLRIEPIYNALQSLNLRSKTPNKKIVLLTPKGIIYNQKKAQEYKNLEEITFICGRYEGIDARLENFVDEEVSLGNFVLSGGELPALAIMESVTRLLPGVLEKQEASENESFMNNTLEHPQYTRPEEFMGLKVPQVLLSGNHKEIAQWKKDHSVPTKVSSSKSSSVASTTGTDTSTSSGS